MRDIIFLPLDVPKIPMSSDLVALFRGDERYVWWDQEVLLGDPDPSKPLGGPEPWNQKSQMFAPLIEHINRYLPFEWLTYVRLARARNPVGLHVDDNYEVPPFPHHKAITRELKDHHLANEPIGYRVMLSGSRDTFYFCKQYDPEYKREIRQPKTYVSIPDDTDFFLIRNYQQPHGVDCNHLDVTRIVGFLLGRVNPDAHRDLITRSMARYPQHILRDWQCA